MVKDPSVLVPGIVRARAEALLRYIDSLPDEWLPGELEEHRRRMAEEPGYDTAPIYVRPPQFDSKEQADHVD